MVEGMVGLVVDVGLRASVTRMVGFGCGMPALASVLLGSQTRVIKLVTASRLVGVRIWARVRVVVLRLVSRVMSKMNTSYVMSEQWCCGLGLVSGLSETGHFLQRGFRFNSIRREACMKLVAAIPMALWAASKA